MEALLALSIALAAFAIMMFLIGRSLKLMMAIGVGFIMSVIANELGFLEMMPWS